MDFPVINDSSQDNNDQPAEKRAMNDGDKAAIEEQIDSLCLEGLDLMKLSGGFREAADKFRKAIDIAVTSFGIGCAHSFYPSLQYAIALIWLIREGPSDEDEYLEKNREEEDDLGSDNDEQEGLDDVDDDNAVIDGIADFDFEAVCRGIEQQLSQDPTDENGSVQTPPNLPNSGQNAELPSLLGNMESIEGGGGEIPNTVEDVSGAEKLDSERKSADEGKDGAPSGQFCEDLENEEEEKGYESDDEGIDEDDEEEESEIEQYKHLALSVLDEARAICQKYSAEDPDKWADHESEVLVALGELMELEDRPHESLAHYQSALEIRQRLHGTDKDKPNKRIAEALAGMGLIHRKINDYVEAEKCFSQTKHILERLLESISHGDNDGDEQKSASETEREISLLKSSVDEIDEHLQEIRAKKSLNNDSPDENKINDSQLILPKTIDNNGPNCCGIEEKIHRQEEVEVANKSGDLPEAEEKEPEAKKAKIDTQI